MALAPVTRISLNAALQPRRIAVLATLCLTLAGLLPSSAAGGWRTTTIPPNSAAPDSEAARVLELAESKMGARFRFGAIGPTEFDCSGFVFWAFREAGLRDRIGYKRKGATAYRDWFIARGWRSPASKLLEVAQPGDILIWGYGHHAGLYIGNGWAISALINPWGVTIHKALKIDLPLTDVLHVQMARDGPGVPGPTPTPSPTPTPTPTPTADPTATP